MPLWTKRTIVALLLAATLICSLPAAGTAEEDGEIQYGQTTSSVNFRSLPNTDCEVIDQLEPGERLRVLAYEDGWYRVMRGNVVGYIRGDYLFVNSNGTRGAYILEDGVLLRGAPSENAYAVKSLTGGQGVKIKAMIGEWCFILADDYCGYVLYEQLKMTQGTSAEGTQLYIGMEGTDVRKLQQELYRRGFLSKADISGVFGAKTRTAVMEFQKLADLSVDGRAGVDTQNAIYDSTNNITKANAVYNQVKGTVELLNWFEGGSDWLARYSVFTVTDVRTGLSFRARRFGGWYHADSEPLTAADTAIMLRAAGGKWTWNRRPIWITYRGRTVAASMHSMPHMANPTPSNNFDGHFCIHLYKSKVHENSKECPRHQACVMEAYRAGR